MDRLTAMRVFTEVATGGSFRAASDKLDMSRAMVTRYVAEMENWLQARLLQRTTRRVTLTDAGEQALRRCQQMLELATLVEEETDSGGDTLRGQLRLTTSMSFGHAHLAAAIADFLALHPQLKVDMQVGDGALNLVEARIDLAIRISSEPDPLLIGRPLAVCESVLVASPSYLDRYGVPAAPGDLTAHQCLSYANFGKSTWKLSRGKENVSVGVPSRLSANEATVLLHAALSGGGIALQPTYLANAHLARGELLAVLPEWRPPALKVYALYMSRQHLPANVRALLDFLVERFKTVPW
ncbi:LysR family transcriptional regulator [Hydrogenophaga crassostreae]|uniref:LysR family transcriptional regulator n=1 Tax=Hydrogenophaga crassostreae TaxID=1763535 RepID=A0A162Z7B5_9BURK|nr:LysR family transcriptional regulator [Hydrogenophaga crassostreae]AOW13943.1 LysR family transcriptional regulator [Hydrogenophaga crassostreae]OAD44092.1 LysR family transcriptional regulator [Hydrogenophaga crassostreae]